MSTGTRPAAPPAAHPDWRWQHAHAIRSLDDVELRFPGRFDLAAHDRPALDAAIAAYALHVTPYYLDLAHEASPADPIWRLAIPAPDETARHAAERDDPIDDEGPGLRPVRGVTHRYPDRVLLMPTSLCAVHCRHCFRRRIVGRAEHALDEPALEAAVGYVAGARGVHEVILTGGDPLMLSDARVLGLLRRLAAIPHVWTLRIHTRVPVVNPFRVGETLAAGLGALPTPVTVVTHFNHPREVTAAAAEATSRLARAGVATLNQAVLLAGLNDDVETQRALIWALLRAHVRPYALHHPDLVPGTLSMRPSIEHGLEVIAGLRGTVPGHALPRYLLDVPGGAGKVPLEPERVRRVDARRYRIDPPLGPPVEYVDHAARSDGSGPVDRSPRTPPRRSS